MRSRNGTPSGGPACCRPLPALPPAVREGTRRLAPICRALGDETRLQIVALLARARGCLCACEIEACFDLSQPTISHHLRVLRESGLVLTERRGTWIHYRLQPQARRLLRSVAALAPAHGGGRRRAAGRPRQGETP